jgi:hypothetical protein
VKLSMGERKVNVTWAAPAKYEGTEVVRYEVRLCAPNDATCAAPKAPPVTVSAGSGALQTQFDIATLKGVEVRAAVVAINQQKPSGEARSTPGVSTTFTVPGAPTVQSVQLRLTSLNTVEASFRVSANGDPTTCTIDWGQGSETQGDCDGAFTKTKTFTSPTTATVSVSATNRAGDAVPLTDSRFTYAKPGPVTLVAVRGQSKIEVGKTTFDDAANVDPARSGPGSRAVEYQFKDESGTTVADGGVLAPWKRYTVSARACLRNPGIATLTEDDLCTSWPAATVPDLIPFDHPELPTLTADPFVLDPQTGAQVTIELKGPAWPAVTELDDKFSWKVCVDDGGFGGPTPCDKDSGLVTTLNPLPTSKTVSFRQDLLNLGQWSPIKVTAQTCYVTSGRGIPDLCRTRTLTISSDGQTTVADTNV